MSGRLTIQRARSIGGSFRPPSDKSLTHRAYMLAAIASGESVVRNPLRGEDCESTLRCLHQLGLRYEWLSSTEIRLIPATEWTQPDEPLDCGNSGTTMRLMAGLLASRPLDVTMIGDASLSRRPMKRVAEPLRLMGAMIEGDTPPLHIVGGSLKGICYDSPVPSAQIKSCALLAGLRASGRTRVTEPSQSRDHTERMLRKLGVQLAVEKDDHGRPVVSLAPPLSIPGFEFRVPGDISSGSFLLVAAAVLGSEELVAREMDINPTRTGLLDVLKQVGLDVDARTDWEELGEPIADVSVRRTRSLCAFQISSKLVPRLIDEIPVLAVLATQCEGTTLIQDAAEMRVKESDRIEGMAEGLRRMGANIETFADGMAITGPSPLNGIQIDAKHDHRIAMSFAIAGLIADGETVIDGADSIATSYPEFENDLRRLVNV